MMFGRDLRTTSISVSTISEEEEPMTTAKDTPYYGNPQTKTVSKATDKNKSKGSNAKQDHSYGPMSGIGKSRRRSSTY